MPIRRPTPDPHRALTPGEVIEVEITGLSFGGEGIARHGGFVIFVPRGLPGDRLTVRLGQLKKRYGASRIVGVVSPSPHRREAGCPLFEGGGGPHLGCGGCQWLHLACEEQVAWKRKFVEDAMKRIGGLEVEVAATRRATATRGSRNKLSASMGSSGSLGLCIEHSPEVLEVRHCPMELDANNAALEALQSLMTATLRSRITQVHLRAAPSGEVSLCLYEERPDPAVDEIASRLVADGLVAAAGAAGRSGYRHLAGKRSLTVAMKRIEYEVPIDAFFQTNYPQAEVLIDLVRSSLQAKPGERVLDLYAGVGFFALDFALDGAKVTVVESHPAALAATRRSARRLRLDGSFIRARVEPALFRREELAPPFDRIVLDPPRAGCGPEISQAIASLGAKRIVYVSCSPDTLARDLETISSAGYRVVDCVPIDMFPQTYHVEVVAVLERT